MFTAIAVWENLLVAFYEASRGKRGRPEVAAFEHRLEDNLIALQQELLERCYQPGTYDSFYWSWLQAMQQRLALLRLTLHPGAHPRPVTEGIPFLGFTVFPGRRRLKRRKGVQFQSKLRNRVKAWQAGMISTDTLVASIDGWVNHVRYGNTVGLRKEMLSAVPAEVLQLVSHLDR